MLTKAISQIGSYWLWDVDVTWEGGKMRMGWEKGLAKMVEGKQLFSFLSWLSSYIKMLYQQFKNIVDTTIWFDHFGVSSVLNEKVVFTNTENNRYSIYHCESSVFQMPPKVKEGKACL